MTREGTRRELLRIGGWGAALGAAGLPAFAEEPVSPDNAALYSADAIVTGTDMRQQPWGFAQCLREVLVKVSGDPRLKDDARVVDLANRAHQFVTSFDYADLMAGIPKKDDQGSYDRPHRLTVHFDPAKIDALISQLGDTPWRGKRPVIVPVLMIQGPKPPSYLLSAETPRGEEQRGAFAAAAGEFGMMVRIPTERELGAWVATIDRFQPKPPPTDGSEAIVTGTLDWSETLPGWIGQWQTRWNGTDHRWGISGVNYDAAFRDIVRGVVLLASGRGSPD
ncbi:MAG TPA: DUF2066 domain-containing protein [Stellaceae bacterium]|nr:DUF2066 domain-containing protein [Stellaceae bacterium]